MVYRRSSIFLALALLLSPLSARAAAPATPAPAPSASERTFLATIMRELPKRYPTPQAAAKAGYFRYGNEDSTGAISYVNDGRYWNVTDPLHPSQLWYDVRGRLLGADYSVLQSNVPAGGKPTTLGIDPKRFSKNGAHVHYVTCTPAGACTYGKSVTRQRYAKYNGGDYRHPTAAGLVKAGAVKDAASVRHVFLYQGIWDVSVWVVPNPLGQFAETNPTVKPSPTAGKGEDEPLE
jgi:hypothetical protein